MKWFRKTSIKSIRKIVYQDHHTIICTLFLNSKICSHHYRRIIFHVLKIWKITHFTNFNNIVICLLYNFFYSFVELPSIVGITPLSSVHLISQSTQLTHELISHRPSLIKLPEIQHVLSLQSLWSFYTFVINSS